MRRRLLVPIALAAVAGVLLEQISSARSWSALGVAAVGLGVLTLLLALAFVLAVPRRQHMRLLRGGVIMATTAAAATAPVSVIAPAAHPQASTSGPTSVAASTTLTDAELAAMWRQAIPMGSSTSTRS